jgi:general L-amino acid transport system substrate-binding protein
MRRHWILGILLAGLTLSPVAGAWVLEDVRKNDRVRCGVSTGLPGFSQPDSQGRWSGLDVDFCRAVAAAVLGDAQKVEFLPLTPGQRLPALTQGRIDLLARNTTWTMERDIVQGVEFAGVNFYDGQGFMVRGELGVRSALGLDGVTLCVQRDTTSATNVKQYFALNRMRFRLLEFDGPEAATEAYAAGQCEAMTSDRSQLYALRSRLAKPQDSVILPEVISREPLSPAVREGDANWLNIVRWTLFAMIDAEEQGIDSTNVERIRKQARNPAVRHFLGLDGETGQALGLEGPWVFRILKQVGNYAESYERNLGKDSPVQIKRGLNALWRDGGLLYAPPAR